MRDLRTERIDLHEVLAGLQALDVRDVGVVIHIHIIQLRQAGKAADIGKLVIGTVELLQPARLRKRRQLLDEIVAHVKVCQVHERGRTVDILELVVREAQLCKLQARAEAGDVRQGVFRKIQLRQGAHA